jgi:sigma-B regulation protein RsbU (phosphoserine phosphatase)
MAASPEDILPPRVHSFYEMVWRMSLQRDPESLLRAYREHAHFVVPFDHVLSLSRKGVPPPRYRITRSTRWTEEIDPWREPHRLPLLEGGWLGEMLYAGRPARFDRLVLPPSDPAAEYFDGMQSVLAVPVFDDGEPHYMVFPSRAQPGAYTDDDLATFILTANLIGRVNGQIILAEKLQAAYDALDRELQVVADIQRSLLPAQLPLIPGIDIATHYRTSARAGGDYYDFFPLSGGACGILLADVSGHGTPAAVVTAMLHAIVHADCVPLDSPAQLLKYLNERLLRLVPKNTFVTMFYGILSPHALTLRAATAGHDPPRLKRARARPIEPLALAGGFPLAISESAEFPEQLVRLQAGDRLLFYTDGITEAFGPAGELFGIERLDAIFARPHSDSAAMIAAISAAIDEFTGQAPPHDDRSLLALSIAAAR